MSEILSVGTRIRFTKNISLKELFPDDPDEFIEITGTIKQYVPKSKPFCAFYVVDIDRTEDMSPSWTIETVAASHDITVL